MYFDTRFVILIPYISQNENFVSIIRGASKPSSGSAKNRHSKGHVPPLVAHNEVVGKQDGDTEEDRELILRFFAMSRRSVQTCGVVKLHLNFTLRLYTVSTDSCTEPEVNPSVSHIASLQFSSSMKNAPVNSNLHAMLPSLPPACSGEKFKSPMVEFLNEEISNLLDPDPKTCENMTRQFNDGIGLAYSIWGNSAFRK